MMPERLTSDREPLMGREHWVQVLGTVGSMVALGGGMLVGATLWIEASISASSTASLAAINAQASIFSKAQSDNEKRITTLEVQRMEADVQRERLATQIEQLRIVVGDEASAVQRLNDLLPAKIRR